MGGTFFVGRALVEQLLLSPDSYEITLFNRGRTNTHLFPNLPKIHGNRETDDIAQLKGKTFDAVIDVSSYFPLSLEKLTQLLKGNVGRYIYVSTASVYDLEAIGESSITEDSTLLTCSTEQKTDTSMATYGQRKVACEEVLLSSGIDSIIMRPGVIYGNYDPFDRHYYWLYRIKKNSKVLVPTGSDNLSAHTFVNDFARALEQAIHLPQHRKTYNAITHPLVTFQEMLQAMADAVDKNPEWVEADLEFQEAAKLQPWSDLPLWINGNFFMVTNEKIVKDFGITFDSIAESFRKSAAYYDQLLWQEPNTGLGLDEEKELIKSILY